MVAVALGASQAAVSSFAADGSPPAWALRLLGGARVVGAAAAARQVSALGDMATAAGETKSRKTKMIGIPRSPCFFLLCPPSKRMVGRSVMVNQRSSSSVARACLYACMFVACFKLCALVVSAGILAGSMCMDDTLAALVSGTLAGTVRAHTGGQIQRWLGVGIPTPFPPPLTRLRRTFLT